MKSRPSARRSPPERYDVVLDIQGLLRSALVCRWTGRPSIGYTRRTVREPIASFFYSRHLDLPEEMGRCSATELLRPKLWATPSAGATPSSGSTPRRNPCRQWRPRTPRWPSTRAATKLWPEAHWVTLCRELFGARAPLRLLLGSAVEEERVRRIARRSRAPWSPRAPARRGGGGFERARASRSASTRGSPTWRRPWAAPPSGSSFPRPWRRCGSSGTARRAWAASAGAGRGRSPRRRRKGARPRQGLSTNRTHFREGRPGTPSG